MKLQHKSSTAGRHIGRRPENDTLFTNSGAVEKPLSVLEPYSKRREDALLSESQHTIRTENIARLQTSVSDLVELDLDCFTANQPNLPAISTETYLHVTRQLLGFISTTRVQ